MVKDLKTQIHDALTGALTRDDVSAVLSASRQALDKAETEVAHLQRASLDPLVAPDKADVTRDAWERARFDRDRIAAAIVALEQRVAQLARIDAEADKRNAYQVAKAERDALAADLRDRYPALAEELVSLLVRLQASDARLATVNRAIPDGEAWLGSAEAIARDCPIDFRSGVSLISRITAARLPSFGAAGIEFLWTERGSGR
ncbi:hypothetical protein [Kaistia terrae]|uniref:Uncharacterized protein n=1 Tax=Kaistia terrae TaxID=537017 RepID=A0ABW0PV78_9HYPH|nr:hypothetical protein [Kaistia terrae]MCX5579453.1 hypothetical protein [Kaistia terrae]